MRTRIACLVLAFAAAAGSIALEGQMRVNPLDDERGHVGLGLALRHLGNTGIALQATAHPDDENNGLLVKLNRLEGYRTALATATRGNGGQNEIGPELFEALGVLRTQELQALHRFDGTEQYFTRAVDFGYSFGIEETFEKWGRDEIIGDYVHLIRMIRPDVIFALSPTGAGGGQHHQASSILAREAWKEAGDPSKYPDQIAAGLRPWQPAKFYIQVGFAGTGRGVDAAPTMQLDLDTYDQLLGKTCYEIGIEARSMHKCQGQAVLLAMPGPASTAYQLVESTIPGKTGKAETSLFDGIDTTIPGLARFAGPTPAPALVRGLRDIATFVQQAQRAFDDGHDDDTLSPLAAGLRTVRALRSELNTLVPDSTARFEIDTRLDQKEGEFEHAILMGDDVEIETLAEDGVVIPGQPLRADVVVANNGPEPVAVDGISFGGLRSASTCRLTAATGGRGGFGGRGGRGGRGAALPEVTALKTGDVAQCQITATVPDDARPSEPYWHRAGEAGRYTFDADAPFGLPMRPTPFTATVSLAVAGEDVVHTQGLEYRYRGNIFSGEKRSDVLVVPAFSVRVSPDVAILPSATVAAGGTREVRVTVVNDAPGAARGVARLHLPAGWTSTPAEQPLEFSRADEQITARFQVKAAAAAKPGSYEVHADVASPDGKTFDRGFEVIEYPHIRRAHIYYPADVSVKVLDVKVAPNLTLGYVRGVGDDVPQALEQLGVNVTMIGDDDLAWGDLSKFNTIVMGVRAYERDPVRVNNGRLLSWVNNGGTLIVQYNRTEFNDAQYGPYPATTSSDRVTDEFAPVTVLVPDDPIFTTPNKLTSAVWDHWVQERGTYFLGERDPRYRDLIGMSDPFPFNPGVKRGALVETTYGKGRWVYTGLGLWRQVTAGTDGAYLILANLISLGH
jgi:LmbE family N-acetylglucosaminyl deacetylase